MPQPEASDVARLQKEWGLEVLKEVGIHKIEVSGAPISSEPTLFLGNHVSYLDIPLLFTLSNFVFVAKKEVADWPLFGKCATEAGTIFVDRSSIKSKRTVSETLVKGIKTDKKNIVVFPEGTSSIRGKPWKRGALNVAKENDITVQAFRVAYKPIRPVAFIDDDALHTHLWKLLGESDIEASVEFFPAFKVQDVNADNQRLQGLVQNSVKNYLGDLPV